MLYKHDNHVCRKAKGKVRLEHVIELALGPARQLGVFGWLRVHSPYLQGWPNGRPGPAQAHSGLATIRARPGQPMGHGDGPSPFRAVPCRAGIARLAHWTKCGPFSPFGPTK